MFVMIQKLYPIYLPVKFVNFLKSRLTFNISFCFRMFVNTISKSKRRFNVKPSTFYFCMKTKKLADFQICISVHLIFLRFRKVIFRLQACNFIQKETLAQVFSCEFCEIFKNTFFTEHLWTTAS